MQVVGIRTYEVRAEDFPIAIEVAAMNLPICQAVASRVQVKQNGAVTGSFPVTVTDAPLNRAIRYSIPPPSEGPDADLVQNVDCTFPDDAPDDSRYEVTIAPAQGEPAKTTGWCPTINPRTITLTFQYR